MPCQSILSHLVEYAEPDAARVFVLIYAPGMQPRSADASATARPPLSMASSYSNIDHEEAEEASLKETNLTSIEPRPTPEDNRNAPPLFQTLYDQAKVLVDKETMIMPFGTPTGHVHLIRHLNPDIVYIQEALTGEDGDLVQKMTGWVRQIMVAVGHDHGHGGLVDSDDESTLAHKPEKWWQKEGAVGLGKQIDIVDGVRVGEDWKRRVCGHD